MTEQVHPKSENSGISVDSVIEYVTTINSIFQAGRDEHLHHLVLEAIQKTVSLTDTDAILFCLVEREQNTPCLLISTGRPDEKFSSIIESPKYVDWLIKKSKPGKTMRQPNLLTKTEPTIPGRADLIRTGVQSFVAFRRNITPDLDCILAYFLIGRSRQWSDPEMRMVTMASDLISAAVTRYQIENENRKNILRFQALYSHSPLAIWEEDFSAIKKFITRKRFRTKEDCRDFFYENPDTAIELMRSIRILDVNETTVKLWNHTDRASLVGNLRLSHISENRDKYIDELIAIYENRLYYRIENMIITGANGKDSYVNLFWNVMPGHEKDWSQVLVSAVDNTAQINTELSLRSSEARLRMLVDNAEDMIFLQDHTSRLLFFNSPTIYGLKEEGVSGNFPQDILPAEYSLPIDKAFIQVMEQKKPVHYETQVGSPKGRLWMSFLAYPILDRNQAIHAVGTIGRNITRQKEAEMALDETKKDLSRRVTELERRNAEISMLSEMLTMLQFSQELDEAYKLVGPVLRQLFPGISGTLLVLDPTRNELITRFSWGKDPAKFRSFRNDECWALRTGKPYLIQDPLHAVLCGHIGSPYPSSSYCVPILLDNIPAGCISLQPEMEDREFRETEIRLANNACEQISLAFTNIKLREGLRQQAIHDGLTGLYNRLYLDESMTRELYRQERSGQALSVIMMDLDHLKEINDIYGHAAGDSVLRALGHLLKQSVRASDLHCRYGGDEFVLVMPDTNLETARKRAEKIADLFRKLSIPFGTQTLGGYSLSIGIATSPQHGHTSQDLLAAADAALYQAKRSGRDRIISATSDQDEPSPE
jgi:diguanylate cyclase (GGDEF)-like protein/PAS domain S-box-containing protein